MMSRKIERGRPAEANEIEVTDEMAEAGGLVLASYYDTSNDDVIRDLAADVFRQMMAKARQS
jgi:hypothetical protein